MVFCLILQKLLILRFMFTDSPWTTMTVERFHSFTVISLFDIDGKEVLRKTISVNDPLRYGGITIYQTDWSISALQVIKDDEGPFNLAMTPLKVNGDKKLYGTSSAQLNAPGIISNSTSLYHPIPQGLWDGDMQNLQHMGFDPNPAVGNLGQNGC